MKIAETKVTKIYISDIKNLDPITVILEDFNPGQGKITIECFGKAWTSYWNAMGKDNTIDKFFCDCDNDYLAKNLAPQLKSSIPDEDGLNEDAKKTIIERRKHDEIDKMTARRLWNMTKCDSSWGGLSMDNDEALYGIYGEEWWYCLPQKSNPEYVYLCRIINASREALKTRIKSE